MTRRMPALAALLLAAAPLATMLAPAPLAAKPLAYEDNKLNLKSCAGDDVTARWFGGNISLSQAGKSPGDPSPTAEFMTWDGKCGTFQWSSDVGALIIKHGAEAQAGNILHFVAWDGSRWSATRTGGGFFLIRIADKDDPNPASRMKASGEWLAKNNILGVPAADVLAEGLSGANGG